MGSNGTNGSSGTSGSGTNGTGGTNGSSGTSGTNGSSGQYATAGTSGSSGSTGSSGSNGSLLLSGTTDDGVITYASSLTYGAVESDLKFSSTSKLLTVSGSIDVYSSLRIVPTVGVTGQAGMLYALGTLATASLYFYNGLDWIKVV
jgi:hypothetical protein